jgi:hypothetical protein
VKLVILYDLPLHPLNPLLSGGSGLATVFFRTMRHSCDRPELIGDSQNEKVVDGS